MGYYLMPQAEPQEVNVQLVAAEATRVFVKNHGMPTQGLDIAMDLERQVLQVTDKVTKTSEWFTFAELGFL